MLTLFPEMIFVTAMVSLAVPLHGEVLPDPTRPADYSERQASVADMPEQFGNWDLRAIRSSESGRNAVVNGRLVRIGDEIDTARIVDITPDTVVLDYSRKKLVLKLVPRDIKQRRTASSDDADN